MTCFSTCLLAFCPSVFQAGALEAFFETHRCDHSLGVQHRIAEFGKNRWFENHDTKQPAQIVSEVVRKGRPTGGTKPPDKKNMQVLLLRYRCIFVPLFLSWCFDHPFKPPRFPSVLALSFEHLPKPTRAARRTSVGVLWTSGDASRIPLGRALKGARRSSAGTV